MRMVNFSSGQPLDQLRQEGNTAIYVLSEEEGIEHRSSLHPLGFFPWPQYSTIIHYRRGIHFGRHLFASETLSFVSERHRDRAVRRD